MNGFEHFCTQIHLFFIEKFKSSQNLIKSFIKRKPYILSFFNLNSKT